MPFNFPICNLSPQMIVASVLTCRAIQCESRSYTDFDVSTLGILDMRRAVATLRR
jgi:hypothetical protein